jgi:hypothetical protein
LNESDAVFQPLIANETVIGPSMRSMVTPFSARRVVRTITAEFYPLLFYRTRDKRASDLHSAFAFVASAPAFRIAVIAWAESARKAADTDSRITDIHDFLLQITIKTPGQRLQSNPKK